MEILDSRGNPTVAAGIELDNQITTMASVPSGASTGSHEAKELRDNDTKRYLGRGVKTAVKNIDTKIAKAIKGMNPENQVDIDNIMLELDGTHNKASLGANAILAVSLAVAKAAAKHKQQTFFQYLADCFDTQQTQFILPTPLINIINGGAHADNNVDIQEFMIVPSGFHSFSEAIRCGSEIFQHLKKIIKSKNMITSVGDEGGFAPNLSCNEQAIEIILEATNKAGYSPGKDVFIALDVAASEFYKDDKYVLESENKKFTNLEFADYLVSLAGKYPIISIEDPMAEDDWQGWENITSKLGDRVQIVGDDLFVTNSIRLQKGIDTKAANSILIKPNQIGTLTETFHTIKTAMQAGFSCIMSHRSGETEDTYIADLAIACGCGQIKTGSLCRSERIAKYNRLLIVEQLKLKDQCKFAQLDNINCNIDAMNFASCNA